MKKKIVLVITILPFLIFFILLQLQLLSGLDANIASLENNMAALENEVSNLQQEVINALLDR